MPCAVNPSDEDANMYLYILNESNQQVGYITLSGANGSPLQGRHPNITSGENGMVYIVYATDDNKLMFLSIDTNTI